MKAFTPIMCRARRHYPKAVRPEKLAKYSFHAGSPHTVSTNATQSISAVRANSELRNGFSLYFSARA
jgi:isopentenyl diphosphate isomerase/L-lactate dehydrogenase-like FMN-dependent dehydrogenase